MSRPLVSDVVREGEGGGGLRGPLREERVAQEAKKGSGAKADVEVGALQGGGGGVDAGGVEVEDSGGTAEEGGGGVEVANGRE